MDYTDLLILWFVFSVLIVVIWGMSINEPCSTKTGDTIWTIICGILALPITFLILLVMVVINIIVMRSKVFQKVLDNIENKSFWYRFKLKMKVELHCIKVLGIRKYILKQRNNDRRK
jgi:hypothetical protein